MGRHGGRSAQQQDHLLDIEDRTSFAGATALALQVEGVKVLPTPLVSAGTAPPWWDDAPVPPPVVVASADGRTPAVSFAPDADPFSAGGVFAPPVCRDGEPAVVVHPAPDAAVLRSRRGRSATASAVAAPSAHQEVLSLLAERNAERGQDTGSLVRPYVGLADTGADAPVGAGPGAGPAVSDPRPARRGRRSGGPLDRIIDIGPAVPVPPRPVGDWQAPWSGDETSSPEPTGRSLFEPSRSAASSGVASAAAWAPPAHQGLPSRKALRARERASGHGVTETPREGPLRDVSARTTSRRLAKSGVLAVTAVGVVAASAPNALSAFGWQLSAHPVGPSAQAALVGLGSGALSARDVTSGSSAGGAIAGASTSLSAPSGDNAAAARKDAMAIAKADAAIAARAGDVASGAGRTLVDVARDQVLAEAARKATIAQQVSRNVVRDPRSYARLLLQERGWSDQFTCLNLLWDRESGWNYQAYNPSSGAYGIPQALPGSKMASIASDWRTNPATQIKWGLNYIAERYGTPCGAWGHSQATGWY